MIELDEFETEELRAALKGRLTTLENLGRTGPRVQRALRAEQADKAHALFAKIFPGEAPRRVTFAPLPAAPWKTEEIER